MPPDSDVCVVLVYPEALGTYGDRGNALALMHRARARQIPCRVVEVGLHDPVPRLGDVYLLGGGEDASMVMAWRRLAGDGALGEAVDRGAACFGVCAGYQLLAEAFTGPDGELREGLGLLDVRCGRLPGARAVGEVLAESEGVAGAGFLTGFENHQGSARLGPRARPLGRLERGTGNGDRRTEGAVQGRVIGTYLHGPALVRNDRLADHLLELVVGELPAFDDGAVRLLRAERLAAVRSAGRPWRRRRRRQVAVQPPSIMKEVPVTESVPGPQRKPTSSATSAGSTSRLIGVRASSTLSSTSSSPMPWLRAWSLI
jgi:lipid II isoglutaminyl synthase (glutamine-hydrolysing)